MRKRSGLSRLGHYLPGQRLRVAALGVCGVLMAAAPVLALLIVRDAIDNAMLKDDKARLARDVIVYLVVMALAWVLQWTLVRGLAKVGQNIVLGLRRISFDHLTSLSLRYLASRRRAGSSRA